MIIRIWHGRTSLPLGDAYEQFLRSRAIPDYRSVAGNLGAFVLRRDESDACHFLTVSLWSSMEEIQAFAGEPVERAKYYDEDRDYLLEFEPTVVHYTLQGAGFDPTLGFESNPL
jgi:heme-degrading monooxygenase HmoA